MILALYDDSEEKAFNKTTTELIKGEQMGEPSREPRTLNRERWTGCRWEIRRGARMGAMPWYAKRGVSVKQLAEQVKQKLLTSKMNYRRLKNLRIRQENEFMSNQWDKASPAEKLINV